MKKPLVVLLSTGLGSIKRGYENHISTLGDALLEEKDLPFECMVLAGKTLKSKQYKTIPSLSRKNGLLRLLNISWKKKFQIEQASFFIGMLPLLFQRKPALIYLAEYELYCWLFKLRKWARLSYGLVLYTGGMAIPGLFDAGRDKVHHVSDALLETATRMGIPIANQVLIPHFIRTNFLYDDLQISALRNQANGKRLALVVGAMNTNHKRMDLAASILGKYADTLFPVFVGDPTEESPLIESILKKYFGSEYILTSCSPEMMGTYYAAADFFFSASAYESFGLVYIEALWHGLPMICHAHAGIEKLVGSLAILTDMNNQEYSFSELNDFLANKKSSWTVSQVSHLHVAERFSWTKCKAPYTALLKPGYL